MSTRELNVGRLAMVAFAALAAGCASGTGGSPLSDAPTGAFTPTQAARIASQSQQKLYIANDGGSVLVYSTGKNPKLLQTITDGVPKPFSLWVDDTGILYAVNATYKGQSPNVAEYEPGALTPFFTIANDVPTFGSVAVDSSQNVYLTGGVYSEGTSVLEIYSKGSSSPEDSFSVPTSGKLSGSASLTFDPSGNLLVGVSSLTIKDNAVFRFSTGSQQFTNLGLKKMPGALITADAAGNLYVGGPNTSGDTRVIAVYAPNQTKPTRMIHLSQNAIGVDALTVSADGTLYVASEMGEQHLIYEFKPGASKPDVTLDFTGQVEGEGLALSP
jgi:hypothetical protein